jgi:hypothetical protein
MRLNLHGERQRSNFEVLRLLSRSTSKKLCSARRTLKAQRKDEDKNGGVQRTLATQETEEPFVTLTGS